MSYNDAAVRHYIFNLKIDYGFIRNECSKLNLWNYDAKLKFINSINNEFMLSLNKLCEKTYYTLLTKFNYSYNKNETFPMSFIRCGLIDLFNFTYCKYNDLYKLRHDLYILKSSFIELNSILSYMNESMYKILININDNRLKRYQLSLIRRTFNKINDSKYNEFFKEIYFIDELENYIRNGKNKKPIEKINNFYLEINNFINKIYNLINILNTCDNYAITFINLLIDFKTEISSTLVKTYKQSSIKILENNKMYKLQKVNF